MTPKQNITLALEPALIKKARAVAARRGLSVSALLGEELRQLVREDAQYSAAHRRALALFLTPIRLGGKPVDRDALHERHRLR